MESMWWLLRRVWGSFVALWNFLWLHAFLSFFTTSLVFLLISLTQSFVEFSDSLKSHSITLHNFSPAYVTALNESISLGQPIQFDAAADNTTSPAVIPRIIHRTYKTEDIPSHWKETYESCRTMNPTYEQYFWTDESARQFIEAHFDWFLPTYDAYPYNIQRADAIRYFLLWHYGGVYIDMDIACRRPLDPLLDFSAWMPKTQPYGVSNDLMASTPGHPFITKVALGLHDHDGFYLSKYITVFFTTGPMYLSRMLTEWFRKVQNGPGEPITMPHGVAILPSLMYDTTAYSFFGHAPGSTWHGNDVAVVSYLYKHWRKICLGVVVLGLLVLTVYILWARRRRSKYTLIPDGHDVEARLSR
ncbi:nucleotide-diphospho-sugar transferase [Aspergillus bertholletiae]|uniref:Nucleotide-diphospho-sugar transferase n=1 Tax=Aspergillus bertholletiae TaxID=1226010 RepID=A0A5N7BG59_9EURO|nr:nucleotide-diphospho-sugar transferase [Aspergillus bertholletiae]